MKKILILCYGDPNKDPRPNRMIRWLMDENQITVVGEKKIDLAGITSISLFVEGPPSLVKKNFLVLPSQIKRFIYATLRIVNQLNQFFNVRMKNYDKLIWKNIVRGKQITSRLGNEKFDIIISHDLALLPLAFSLKYDNTRVIFDAREYYPKNYDDQWQWKILSKPVNIYLCEHFLHRCDKIITVSNGLSLEYQKEYSVFPEVMMSLPPVYNLCPVPVDPEKIKIVHHGLVSFSRRTELMVEMMDYVDKRFSLDLLFLPGEGEYWDKIKNMVSKRKNVRILPPVNMQDIIPTINHYDIGLFLVPPTNFNLEFVLPNKFFEFIQARLAVAIGPNPEMKRIAEQYDFGVISEDFLPQSLAEKLNKLDVQEIMYLKNQANIAAESLNENISKKRMNEIVNELSV